MIVVGDPEDESLTTVSSTQPIHTLDYARWQHVLGVINYAFLDAFGKVPCQHLAQFAVPVMGPSALFVYERSGTGLLMSGQLIYEHCGVLLASKLDARHRIEYSLVEVYEEGSLKEWNISAVDMSLRERRERCRIATAYLLRNLVKHVFIRDLRCIIGRMLYATRADPVWDDHRDDGRCTSPAKKGKTE